MTLMLVVVILSAVAAAAVLRCPIPVAAPTAIFTVIIALYVFGCVGLLDIGYWVVLGTVVMVAFFGTIRIWRSSGFRGVLGWITHPAFVAYLLMISIYALRSSGLRFQSWDEFSHWGRVVAVMVEEGALPPYAAADLMFASYPPGLPIWEYFLANLRGDFHEADVFVAYQVLAFAMVLPFASRLSWRRPARIALFIAGAGLLMVSFFPLESVLIDPVLAVTFGYCAALAVLGTADQGNIWRHLAPALVVLVMLKSSGVLFAVIVIVLLVVRRGREPHLRIALGRRSVHWPAWIVHSLAGAVCIGFAVLSWRGVLAATGTRDIWQPPVSLGDALGNAAGAFLNRGEQWRIDTTSSFISALSSQPLTSSPIPMTFWAWFALAAALLFWLDRSIQTQGANRPRHVVAPVLLTGAIVYAGGLLYTYLTTFSVYEATNLASYHRYIKIYWFGVLFVCAAAALKATLDADRALRGTHVTRSRNYAVAVGLVLLSLGQVPALAEVLRASHTARSSEARAPYDATLTAALEAGVQPGDRVWFLDQHSTGYGYWVLSYELLQSKTHGWSVGDLRDANDVWTRDLSVQEWSDELEGFDYMVVHHTEPGVSERYGSLFEEPSDLRDGAVFEIRTGGRGDVVLVLADGSSNRQGDS